MNVTKPERSSFSNLTERQWNYILEQFEFEWDLEHGFYQGPERANRDHTENYFCGEGKRREEK